MGRTEWEVGGLATSVWRLSELIVLLSALSGWDPGSALSPLSRGLAPWLGTWLGQVLSPWWCRVGRLQDARGNDNEIKPGVCFAHCSLLSFMTQKQPYQHRKIIQRLLSQPIGTLFRKTQSILSGSTFQCHLHSCPADPQSAARIHCYCIDTKGSAYIHT